MRSLLVVALAATVASCSHNPRPGASAAAPPPPSSGPTAAKDTAQQDTTWKHLPPGSLSLPNADPFPSTYKPFPSRTTLIRNVNILTAAGPLIRNGSILLQDGKIAAVG